MKKIFIISLVLLIVVLFFLGIYNFAFKKSTPIPPKSSTDSTVKVESKTNQDALIIEKSQKIIPISEQGILGAAFDKKNDTILYYSVQDFSAWKSDNNGKGWQKIASEKIGGLKKILWSADRNKVLLSANDGTGEVFYEYDNTTKKNNALKKGMENAVWDNLGSKIFYKYYDQDAKTRTLNIANPDGSDWHKLTDIDTKYISIAQIPMTSLVSFWNSPYRNEETNLQIIGISGGQSKSIFKGRFGADYLWSPNGSMALVSSQVAKDSNKLTLGVIKLDGSYNDLNIPTFASKCVWSADNKTMYYALPGGIPENAQLPNDYLNGKFTTEDTFWKMDIVAGTRERILEPEEISGKHDSSNMFLSPEEDALYFINKVDKKVYKIAL